MNPLKKHCHENSCDTVCSKLWANLARVAPATLTQKGKAKQLIQSLKERGI